MAKYKNTKKDFWNSLNPDSIPMYCPCCGMRMSLEFSSSFRLKLTKNACARLNQQLLLYRQTLHMIEGSIKRHNSAAFSNTIDKSSYIIHQGYSMDGASATKYAQEFRRITGDFDIEHIDEVVKKIHRIKDDENDIDEKEILRLLKPPHLTKGLLDVTKDQKNVEELLTDTIKPSELINRLKDRNKSDNEVIEYFYNRLNKQFPCIMEYCTILSKKGDYDNDILEEILSIFIMYFCDTEGDVNVPEGLNISKFTFGSFSLYRNWDSVSNCLTSFYYLPTLRNQFKGFVEYITEKLSEESNKKEDDKSSSHLFTLGDPSNYDTYQSLTKEIPDYKDVILDSVDFVCGGPAASIPKDAKYVIRKNKKVEVAIEEEMRNEIETDVCGWVPKEKCTESLLLIGGTAFK
jgi:hypothetical protein